jgi:glycogen synthase
MLDAVQRCAALYADQEKWRAAVVTAMHCDNSWHRSAKVYRMLYKKLKG